MFYALTGSGYENYASITSGIGGEMAQKLETSTFIFGQVIGAGPDIRINVQLRDAASDEIFQTYEVIGKGENDIPVLADSLSDILRNYLEIEVLKEDLDYEVRKYHLTSSAEAYRNYIMGMRLFWKIEHTESINYFKNAVELDSNFLHARIFLGWNYGWNLSAGKWLMFSDRRSLQ